MSKVNQNLTEKHIKALRREAKKQKRKYAPKGGTIAAHVKHAQASRFYRKSKMKPKVRITNSLY